MTQTSFAARLRSHGTAALLSITATAGLVAPLAHADGGPIPLRFDASGRPVVSANVNGEAAFDFVVDTAAQRTGIGAPAIDELGLEPAPGMQAQIAGVAGHRTVPMYALDTFEVGGRLVEDGYYYSLTGEFDAGGHGHDGIIGQDIFASGRIVFDWAERTVGFGAGAEAGLGDAVSARLMYGGFFLVPVSVNGVEAIAVIDTGAAESFANPALLAAMPDRAETDAVTSQRMGVSQHEIERVEGFAAGIEIGSARLGTGALTIIDSPTFRTFGLTGTPALILGMDRLSELRGFALDYDLAVFRVLQ